MFKKMLPGLVEVWIVAKMNSQAVMLGVYCTCSCKACLQELMYFNVDYLLNVFVSAF